MAASGAAFAQTAKPAPDAAKPKPTITIIGSSSGPTGPVRATGSAGVPTRIAPAPHFFPETGAEFVVEFPAKPIVTTEQEIGVNALKAVYTQGDITLMANIIELPAALNKPVPQLEDGMIKAEEESAKRQGVKNPKARIGKANDTTYLATIGTITYQNQELTFETRMFYGAKSMFHLTASAPVETYPTAAITAFFDSVQQIAKERQSFSGAAAFLNLTGVVNGGVLNGKAIRLGKAVYPAKAIAARAQGVVLVKVLIDEQGRVIAAVPTSGDPLLFDATVAAALDSEFNATKVNDQPVKIQGIIIYNFVAKPKPK